MTGFSDYKPLRLVAADAEDLQALSACLQDAILKIGDMTYLPRERRFAFVANRFLWEAGGERKSGPFWRARAGAHFDDVRSAKQINIRTDARDAVIEVLAIEFKPSADGAGEITLTFAGGGAVRLEVDAVNAELRDLAGPWRTRMKPAHAD
ncbi:MAG: DUF2948 family protein [Parvularculaceae bacterium]